MVFRANFLPNHPSDRIGVTGQVYNHGNLKSHTNPKCEPVG